MYFSHRTTAILMAAVASTQAAPQMALSSITTVAPTVITGDKMGTAAFSGDLRPLWSFTKPQTPPSNC